METGVIENMFSNLLVVAIMSHVLQNSADRFFILVNS